MTALLSLALFVLIYVMLPDRPRGGARKAPTTPPPGVVKPPPPPAPPRKQLYQQDHGDETDAVPEGLGVSRCPIEAVVPIETLDASALQALLEIRIAQDREKSRG